MHECSDQGSVDLRAVPVRAEFGRDHRPPDPPGVPRGLAGQAIRFAAIGVASTVAYLLLFLALRGPLAAQPANLVALLVTAIANTAANRRLTFGIRGRAQAARHQVKGLIAFAIGLGLTSGALAGLHASAPGAGRGTEVGVLVVANLIATVLRFVLFRSWVFGRRAEVAPAVVSSESIDGSLS